MRRRRGNREGSIYKDNSGRWRASVHIGYRNGRRLRKLLSGRTRAEVAEKLKGPLRDQQLGLPIQPDRQTVGAYLDSWLEQSVKRRVRPKTYVTYRDIVRLHLKPEIGGIRLQKLGPQHVQRLLNSKLESGLSPRTARHVRTTLITALETAVKFGLVPRNVAKLVDPPRAPKREIRPFTVQEAKRFLEAVRGDRLCALFVTALSLGLRLGEVLGLCEDDMDLDRSSLTVRHSLQRINGEPFGLVETKSDASRRTLTLPAVAVAQLRRHLARREHERQLAGSKWKGNPWGLVFVSTVGTPLFQRNVHRRFWQLLDAAGLRRIRPHDLRHSAASLLIAAGVHPKAIQELLGHSSVAFTLQVYAHLFDEAKREAADKMDSILAPVASSGASSRELTGVQ